MPGLVHPSTRVCDDCISAEASESISARLSQVQDLRLPASLLRDHPYPSPAAVQEHLRELLSRDAGVFLERYGLLLSGEELSSFQPLRFSHYEVDFYLKQAEAALQQQQQHEAPQQQQQAQGQARLQRQLSSTVKNRRLAYMRRLEQQGEYFSEQNMRERQPLVWQDCIGRHEGHPTIPTAAPAGERGFADSLLASYDEALLRDRLQQEMEDEEAAMSEHDSDSDEDMNPAPQQHRQQQQQQEEQQQVEEEELDGQEHAAVDLQQSASVPAAPSASLPPISISTPAAASAGRTEAARVGAAAAQQQREQQQGQAAAAAAAGAAGGSRVVDLGPDAMARRRHDFLQEMQHRFLDGLDGEHQDYAAIDADTSLDDDWAREQAQDAEDAYFDAD